MKAGIGHHFHSTLPMIIRITQFRELNEMGASKSMFPFALQAYDL